MSKLTYVVTSESAQVIDGLGTFQAGETKELSADANQAFKNIRGVNLLPANLPADVELTIRFEEEEA